MDPKLARLLAVIGIVFRHSHTAFEGSFSFDPETGYQHVRIYVEENGWRIDGFIDSTGKARIIKK